MVHCSIFHFSFYKHRPFLFIYFMLPPQTFTQTGKHTPPRVENRRPKRRPVFFAVEGGRVYVPESLAMEFLVRETV